MSDLDSSDSESVDSDTQLQLDFSSGKLKPGLNVALPASIEKHYINDVAGMKSKLDELKSKLDWIERLDTTSEPAPAQPGTEIQGGDDIHNDFRREMLFYRQAQATVLSAIPKLHKMGIKTKRPEDYFAQMAKTDDHMKRVRERLLHKQLSIEKSEKAKKLRELRKYGKKVQQEVLLKRQKDKKEMMEAVKKYRKGQKNKLDFLDDLEKPGSTKKQGGKQTDKKEVRSNKKREYKNKKFGFGGQKKRGKQNTSDSARDMSDFNPRVNQKRPGQKVKKTSQSRPGKSRRQNIKNRKK
ncbi:probable rRNA-processing protein EBP2 [Mytilus trossulus]|uniref:probable rRNA-processing protein EBP2 n=1 Tax=Mytilus trossulus TaxID=6551 RepID=UPI0030072E6E